jgi:exodeoxyribonuclease-1
MFGVERGCLAVMWPLASHPSNKNELIAWDLAHDPAELASLDVATLRQRLFTRSADLPEGVARLPVKTVHLNKSPVVIGNLKVLTPALQARWGLDLEQALRHAATARDLPDMSAIWPEVFRRPEADAPVDPEHDLYGGFVGNADRRRLTQLRALDPAALARARTGFDDPRLAGAAAALARPQPPRHPEPRGGRAVAAAPRSPPAGRRGRRPHPGAAAGAPGHPG